MNKFNVLIEGPAGTGKTTCTKTLWDMFDHVQYMMLEPGIETTFGDTGKYPSKPGHVGWNYCPPSRPSWDTLIDNAKKINMLTYEQLTKVSNANRNDYQQFLRLVETLGSYTDQRTGRTLGPVDEWGTDSVLIVDGLSGLSKMAMQLVVGGKPAKSQPDWQIAQDCVENLIDKLVYDTKCSFVLIAHQDRETNEVTGGTEVTVQTLGRKLAPKLPQKFDEVIQAVRLGSTFTWDTATPNIALKTRRLPIRTDLKPDFHQLAGG